MLVLYPNWCYNKVGYIGNALYMRNVSLFAVKPVFVVSDSLRLKHTCSATS